MALNLRTIIGRALWERMGWKPDYYRLTDEDVLDQRADDRVDTRDAFQVLSKDHRLFEVFWLSNDRGFAIGRHSFHLTRYPMRKWAP